MKKEIYIVVFSSHLETEGLDSSIRIANTLEEAQKIMKNNYDYLHSSDCNYYEVYEDTIDEDSYSIEAEYIDGFEFYEAHIEKVILEEKEE